MMKFVSPESRGIVMLKKIALGVVVVALNSQANADNTQSAWVDLQHPKSTAQKVNTTKAAKPAAKAAPKTVPKKAPPSST